MAELRSEDCEDVTRAITILNLSSTESHIPQLKTLLQDDECFIRECAAEPYARLMGMKALPLLLQAQIRGNEDGCDNDTLDAIITDLVEHHKSEVASQLPEMLENDNSKTREQAAWLSGYVASEIEPICLLNALQDENPEVRMAAAGSLASFPGNSDVFESLIEALSDPDEQVRCCVVDAFGYLGDSRALPALQVKLQDSSKEVRLFAKDSIAMIRNPESAGMA